MTLEQLLVGALGGSPLALVMAAGLKVVWGRYQGALGRIEDLHDMMRDRDQAELESWRKIGGQQVGDSTDGE